MASNCPILFLSLLAAAKLVAGDSVSSISTLGIDPAKLDTIFLTPNATGEARFNGYNLSAPWLTNSFDGWGFRIKVAADVPVVEGGFRTVTKIEVDAPDFLVVAGNDTASKIPTDPSWSSLCQQIWFVPGLNSTPESSFDPTCKGVLPGNCIDDLKRSLSDGYDNSRGPGRCPYEDWPLSCVTAGNTSGSVQTSLDTNSSTTTKDGIYGYATLSDDPDPHQLGNFTAYDSAIRQIHVLGLVWGYMNTTTPTENDPKPPVQLSCLRANSFSEGSRRLSAGVSVKATSVWLMAAVVGVASAWLL
ncbi:hypothetical protein B0H66DRAFT_555713 [Apodospora peruviana]|uniref:Uncharacterized protein n=1 Tax=Apodospora peruviana TaxID=516989 RepID=A0AAE0IDD7_9PEZI|nr:hypothetical protein B0H66DRAFT_555713 [Apodospora peruviana]